MVSLVKTLALSTACVLALGVGTALADDAPPEGGPFDLNNTKWLPVAHAGQAQPSQPVAAVAAPAAPEAPAAPVVAPVAAAKAATIAAPARGLNLPNLPGVSSPYALNITSTAQSPSPAAAEMEDRASADPNEPPPPQNWQKAAEAARKAAIGDARENGEAHPPLDIRPSFLPNPEVAPASVDKPPARPRMKNLPAPPIAVAAKKPAHPLASDAAACAAVDNYKKNQLAALESDRQTLTALQSAITELGLQKQLGYLTGMAGTPAGAQSSAQASAQPSGAAAKGQP